MKFSQEKAEIFVPDGAPPESALRRSTHLCIAAHHDDIEIMAPQPILECFQQKERWFLGVIVTDGRGSPRDGAYAHFSDDEMRITRMQEQRKAAVIGEYGALLMLDFPSAAVKDGRDQTIVEEIIRILETAGPKVVYTHNLADKHPTHIGVAVKVIQAMRRWQDRGRTVPLYGCEVWRGLDWLMDENKVTLECSAQSNLQASLLGVFDSQISGGKRYDLAAMGRRLANATFFASHAVDEASGLAYAMDLTPLILDPNLSIQEFVQRHITRFANDVDGLISSVL